MLAPSLPTCVARLQQRLSPPTSVQKFPSRSMAAACFTSTRWLPTYGCRRKQVPHPFISPSAAMLETATPIGAVAAEHAVEAAHADAACDRSRRTRGARKRYRRDERRGRVLPCDRRRPRRSPAATAARGGRPSRQACTARRAMWRSALVSPSVMRIRPRLEELAHSAADSGATGLRTTPGRALLVVGVTADARRASGGHRGTAWLHRAVRRIRAARSSLARAHRSALRRKFPRAHSRRALRRRPDRRRRRAHGAPVRMRQGLRLSALHAADGRRHRRPVWRGGEWVRPRPASDDAHAGRVAGRALAMRDTVRRLRAADESAPRCCPASTAR